MTRIVDLQRRLREIGRIRIGARVPTAGGGTRPGKLDTFRLTSPDRRPIDAAAARWGGTVEPWDAPAGRQWQVVTEVDELAVIVPPTNMAFTQAYEQWTAAGCRVRCDGTYDVVGDLACHCDPDRRVCDIHTRLSVMLPDILGLGVWRLDTQGYYAAVELAGVVDVLVDLAIGGRLLPGRLRLEQRTAKRIGNNGPITLRYAVPVIDVDHPFALPVSGASLPSVTSHADRDTAGSGGGRDEAIANRRLSPVPPPDPSTVFVPSLRDQLSGVDIDTTSSRRQAPPPATGLAPRTDAHFSRASDDPTPYNPPTDPPEFATPDLQGAGVLALRAVVNGLGQDARRAFLDHFGVTLKDLPPDRLDEAQRFVDRLVAERSRTRNTLRGRDETGGPPTGPGGPPVAHDNDTDVPDVLAGMVDPDPASPDVADVARKAAVVFRADYAAAPRGKKTHVIDRLRHALVYAETGGVKASLKDCTSDELVAVWHRLEDIAAGRMTYETDPAADAGVTFTTATTQVTVLWSDLDDPVGAA